MAETHINRTHATDKLRVDYAHAGLFDTGSGSVWLARKRMGVVPLRVAHAQLLRGGDGGASVAEKDRFLCYWYHTPNTGQGLVHGYPIEWEEGHLMIRLDPNWCYRTQRLLAATDGRRVEANIDRQFRWGKRMFELYTARRPRFPLSWHLIGPRPTDSMFYIDRAEAPRPRVTGFRAGRGAK